MANPNVFAQFAQPVRSVTDYLDQFDAQDMRRESLNAARQQNALMSLGMRQKMAADAQATEDRNALQRIASNSRTPDELISALRSSGRMSLMTQADALEKAALERQKTDAEVKAKGAETAKTQGATIDAAIQRYRSALDFIDTPEGAARWMQAQYADPVLGQQMQALGPLELSVSRIPQDPAQFQRWRMQAGLGMEKFLEKTKPTIQTRNLGGTTETMAIDPLTGAVRVTNAAKNTQSPDNAASVGASYANAAAVRETAAATRDAARISAGVKAETDLRQEFADLPEVKKFKQAAPAYKAVVEAAKSNNSQADINLIYGLAKLYDPESVVREGEYDTIANSQSIPEWLKGQAQRLAGGGKLTPATKKQILEQAKIRYDTLEGDVQGARTSYEELARRRNMNPDNVFPRIGGGSRPEAPAPGQPKPSQVLKFDANGNPVN